MSLIAVLTDRLPLKSRLLLGYLLALALIGGLIAVSIVAFNRITSDFERFVAIGQQSRIDLLMTARMAEMQRKALIFTYEGHEAAASEVETLQKELLAEVNRMVQGGQEATKPVAALIRVHLENYYKAFQLLRNQREAQRRVINAEFRDSATAAESLIQQMIDQSRRQTPLQLKLQGCLTSLLMVEKHLFRYFDSFDARHLKVARERLAQVRRDMEQFDPGSVNPTTLRTVRETLRRYQKSLNEVIQRTRGYLYLINVVMPAEAYEILYQSRKLADRVSGQMSRTEQSILANINRTNDRLLLTGSALMSVLLLIFFVIGQSISRPIVRLADTFARLSRGERGANIPTYPLDDEIGQLTQAAQAFQLQNAQTQALLKKSQDLADELGHSNKMLEDSNQQILNLNTTLEQKVEERTAQLQAASAAKSQFLAQMSHELRTPLNAVIGFAQLLERESLSEDQRELVRQVRDSGNTLLGIISDILDFSKIEAGQMRLDSQPFDLPSVLTHVGHLLQKSATDKGIALTVKPPAETLGGLTGDRLRLEQILLNLAGNAVKFTEQGRVDVEVRTLTENEESITLRFDVRDTGIGIANEALGRLFQPFAQADTSISRRFGGTGLGLVISRRLVNAMGGELQVSSEPGRGSLFWFELSFPFVPVAIMETEARPVAEKVSTATQRLTGLKVLAVDDSPINRMVVERALKVEGAHVTLATNGQEALDRLRAQPTQFDVVLMDIQMPVMDGLAATRVIRTELGQTSLPVIALSAGVLAEEQQQAIDAGVNDFLAKPMNLEQMTDMLLRYCRPY